MQCALRQLVSVLLRFTLQARDNWSRQRKQSAGPYSKLCNCRGSRPGVIAVLTSASSKHCAWLLICGDCKTSHAKAVQCVPAAGSYMIMQWKSWTILHCNLRSHMIVWFICMCQNGYVVLLHDPPFGCGTMAKEKSHETIWKSHATMTKHIRITTVLGWLCLLYWSWCLITTDPICNSPTLWVHTACSRTGANIFIISILSIRLYMHMYM